MQGREEFRESVSLSWEASVHIENSLRSVAGVEVHLFGSTPFLKYIFSGRIMLFIKTRKIISLIVREHINAVSNKSFK